jgi:hypothetical protein
MDAPSNRRGSAGGSYSGDLSLPLLGVDRIIEVKVRARGFAQLYDWLEGRDLLVIRADRIEPLIVLPVKLAIQIARAAERAKNSRPSDSPDDRDNDPSAANDAARGNSTTENSLGTMQCLTR